MKRSDVSYRITTVCFFVRLIGTCACYEEIFKKCFGLLGLAILYGASLILIIWGWVIMTSSMAFYGEIVKERYFSLLVKGLAVFGIFWSFVKFLCLGKLYITIGNALINGNSQEQGDD